MADLASFARFARSFQPGEIIFSEYEPGDAFYLIQSGKVRISKIVGNIEKTIDVLQPPEIFGEMAILEGAPRSATAQAVDTVKVLELNRANFEVLMMGNPQIALRLLKLFAKRIWDQKRRFMILTLDDVQAKIADVFLMLAETQAAGASASQEQDGEKREFKVTIDDVAHWAGISPQEAQTILGHFVNQRRLELLPDRVIVRNISDFSRFVNSRRKK
jgi:CRP-like cAMP-binding protein